MNKLVEEARFEAAPHLDSLRRICKESGVSFRKALESVPGCHPKGPSVVAVAGAVNSGKSSLLNVLSGLDHFRVAGHRLTSEVAEVEWRGRILRDTPGWASGVGADDETMLRGLDHVDVFLFCHSAAKGELGRDEAECYQLLVERSGLEGLADVCVIPCLTKIDAVPAEEREQIALEVTRSIERINEEIGVRGTPALLQISASFAERAQDEARDAAASAFHLESGVELLEGRIERALMVTPAVREFRRTRAAAALLLGLSETAAQSARTAEAQYIGRPSPVTTRERELRACEESIEHLLELCAEMV